MRLGLKRREREIGHERSVDYRTRAATALALALALASEAATSARVAVASSSISSSDSRLSCAWTYVTRGVRNGGRRWHAQGTHSWLVLVRTVGAV